MSFMQKSNNPNDYELRDEYDFSKMTTVAKGRYASGSFWMLGTNTLSKLYLGSEPTGVAVRDDQLQVTLADGRTVAIPLQLIGQLSQMASLPPETQLLILQNPPKIDHVHITDSELNVYLQDGRTLSSPLAWFPRLLHGTPAERNHYELNGDEETIHWPDLDEDINLLRLLEGGRSIESENSIKRWLLSRQSKTTVKSTEHQ
jgi:hypothetical protein